MSSSLPAQEKEPAKWLACPNPQAAYSVTFQWRGDGAILSPPDFCALINLQIQSPSYPCYFLQYPEILTIYLEL